MDWLRFLLREVSREIGTGLQLAAAVHAQFAPRVSAQDAREIAAVPSAFGRGLEAGAAGRVGRAQLAEIQRGIRDLVEHSDDALPGVMFGVVWAVRDDAVSLAELPMYLASGNATDDFRQFARVVVTVALCISDQRYAALSEEAGRALGSAVAEGVYQNFGSPPPPWLVILCGGFDVSVETLWRGICVGKLLSPLILAVLTAGGGAAAESGPALVRAAGTLRSLLSNVRLGSARSWLTRRLRRRIAAGSGAAAFSGSVGAAQLPVIVIRYTQAMQAAPTDAQFFRFNIEWAQSRSPLMVGERLDVDDALRRLARKWMDDNGLSRANLDAGHPLDSIANPFLNPHTTPGSTYYFGHRSVNRSYGSQLQRGIDEFELELDDEFLVRFEGFPSYADVPPLAPVASPPGLRLRAR